MILIVRVNIISTLALALALANFEKHANALTKIAMVLCLT